MNVWKPIALCLAAGFAVSIGVQTANATPSPDPLPSKVANGGCGGQPNMASALGSLQSALASLNKAEHNKGGWRVAAINATNTAIAQVQAGCNYAN
jgi:hypothetical protein